MLIPISKILENNSGAVSYNLYDVGTKEVSNWTLREIKEAIKAGCDIRGFAGLSSKGLCSLKLNSYFMNISIAGEKKDGKQYYTVVQRKVYSEEKGFVAVDCVGKDFELKESELINLIKGGAVIAGVKLIKNDALRASRRDIETKNVK